MIHSVFDQFKGDFQYFDVPDDVRINDDQAVPTFNPQDVTALGISSLLAGRPLPAGASPAGRGKVAKGRICGLGAKGSWATSQGPDPSGLGSFSISDLKSNPTPLVVLATAALAGYFIVKKVF
jgi:hypothetical protein